MLWILTLAYSGSITLSFISKTLPLLIRSRRHICAFHKRDGIRKHNIQKEPLQWRVPTVYSPDRVANWELSSITRKYHTCIELAPGSTVSTECCHFCTIIKWKIIKSGTLYTNILTSRHKATPRGSDPLTHVSDKPVLPPPLSHKRHLPKVLSTHFLTIQLTGESRIRECKTRSARKQPAPATQNQNLAMTRQEAQWGASVGGWGRPRTASGPHGSSMHTAPAWPPSRTPYLQSLLPRRGKFESRKGANSKAKNH